jgi:hypothetical protein
MAEPNRSAHKVDSEMAALACPLSTSANKFNDNDDDGDGGGEKATTGVRRRDKCALLLPLMITNADVRWHFSSNNKHGRNCMPKERFFPPTGCVMLKSNPKCW